MLQIHHDKSSWYFRGQADYSWPLTPSLVRHFNGQTVNRSRAYGIERSLLFFFQSQAHLHIPNSLLSQMKTDVAWLMLMQHYSCPTRLIDWTYSPMVAIYFAVEQNASVDGAIWFFNAPNLDTQSTECFGKIEIQKIFDEEYLHPAIYPILATVETERSAAQQGVFSLCLDIIGNHDKHISDCFVRKFPNSNSIANKRLNKIIIPSALKSEFLSRLSTMNINARTLFPGADGLGRAASEIIRQRIWSGM